MPHETETSDNIAVISGTSYEAESVPVSVLEDLLWFVEVEAVDEETDTGDNIMISGSSRLTRSVPQSFEELSGYVLSELYSPFVSSTQAGLDPPNLEEEV